MNIQRFTAATSREALAKARMAFGEGTLILSNRQTATGVEVMATAEDTVGTPPEQAAAAQPRSTPRRTAIAAEKTPVAEDAEQLAMSTLSFQDYVRERMLRRRHEAMEAPAAPAAAPARPAATRMAAPSSAPIVTRASSLAERAEREVQTLRKPAASAQLAQLAQRLEAANAAQAAAAAAKPPAAKATPHALPFVKEVLRTRPQAVPIAPVAAPASQGIVDELHAMKEMIEERFSTLAWLGQAKQDPIQSNLMLKLIRSGYSPSLARALLERMPAEASAAEAVHWIIEVLQRNLHTDAQAAPLYAEGGVFALVGATGVGKTTTAAKLAAHCVQVHGAASVGLITLDTYRVGAHEQLRSYGRMLGVVAHLAHDRAALQDLLGLLANKKMVLVDTTGVAPRDPRKQGMLDMLDLPGVQRLLVVNAGGQGDQLDDVMGAFKTGGVQQTILSKVDEAVKLGPVLDATIRHQLLVRGICNGQRVPEDFERADAAKLVAASMRSNVRSAYDPKAADLSFIFSTAGAAPLRAERAHA
ncbi:flagellar biosynthesis protein FlhF [Pseudorhodoferax sp. Leaf274]|uniref:flagellar biosynthesis protein FlhF n=1 Tax=Pseudorhodoferax sp. Leaf274 TaxID=1736318 RepID=UPI0007033E61|nr:flagellar biosynthesis protein FlhF [Pseudorhodoferax sp. Leaf274]KQP45023.1 flagellar biosynthesis protein FlhF [Pseudorhodoferax sp. Leaf274]